MLCKSRGVYRFLGPSWVLITYNICPPVMAVNLGGLVALFCLSFQCIGGVAGVCVLGLA